MVVEREGAAGTQSQIRVNQNGAAVFSFVYVLCCIHDCYWLLGFQVALF